MNPGLAFTNRLGMRFLPAGTTGVLVSAWETRVRDFSAFVAATGHDATRGMSSLGGDRSKERGCSRHDPGFPQGADHPVVGVSWEADWPASMTTIPSWRDGWARTSPVGAFRANARGLHDLGGNLWEWCEDFYRREMNAAEVLAAFPRTAEDGEGRKWRVARGGSWRDSDPLAMRTSTRRRGLPELRVTAFGFRCVLAPA